MPVVAVGELVVDWLSTKPGQNLFQAQDFHRALGGNSSNVGVGLNRLGTPVRIIAKIGDDFHGEYLRQTLRAQGIDLDYVISDPQHGTAQCYMTTTSDGNHEYRNWPRPHAADMLHPDEIRTEAFENVRFLHATGISFMAEPRRQAIQRAFDLARAQGIVISFDGLFPTGRVKEARQIVESALFQAQLLKLNEYETKFWADFPGAKTVVDAAERVFERYKPVALFVTQAEQGSFVLSQKGIAECPPIEVDCLCGVGAGDAYIAGVLHCLYRDFADRDLDTLTCAEWRRVGMVGNITGGLATRFVDAHSGIPSQAELTEWLGKIPT